MISERIRAVHWAYDNLEWFTYENYDDFVCAVDQRVAQLMKWA